MGYEVVTGHRLARLVLEMVGELHGRGYESLYIDPIMAPSGCYWRYEIGAMISGQWPNKNLPTQGEVPQPVRGSISDTPKWMVSWSEPTGSLEILVNRFIDAQPELLKHAREPNKPYVDWFKKWGGAGFLGH